MGRHERQASGLLTGWHAIAGHFGRNQSTVRRWAATGNLPVHRATGEKGVSVYAYTDELDAWLRRKGAGQGAAAADRNETPERRASWSFTATGRRMLYWTIPALVALVLLGAGAMAWGIRGVADSQAASNVPEEAQELYLRGTWLWNRRTPEGIAGAIEALSQAIDIHPEYAEAHAGLAMTYNLARQYSGMPGWEAYPKAEEHARRAVELDPDLAFGQAVLAFVEFHWLWQVEPGLARFEAALRLDPDDANTLMWYGSSLIHAGRHDEALAVLARAQELDPDNTTILNMKGQALFYSGREEEGLALVEELIARDPDHPWNYYALALLRLGQMDYAGYLRNYARLGDLIGVPRYRAVAEAGLAALSEEGEKGMAEALAAMDKEFYDGGEALAWDVAQHYAMVGRWREAIAWLRISLERHEERLIGLGYNTAFWPIRYRPEFKQIVAEVGLPLS